jgi:two-component system nitrogen regulation response regulator GlnG
MTKILVIDDDRTVRTMVQRGLQAAGLEVIEAATGAEGIECLEKHQPSVALVDIFLPEINGLELYRKLRANDRKLPIIFITVDMSSETTIQAMQLGAFDYISKPLNLPQLRSLVLSAVEARRLMDLPVALPLEGKEDLGERFIGRSPAMVDVFKLIGRVAAKNVTVLIRGESGCGKELVARAIVQHSARYDQPFVAVNCAAIPDQLLESELFGHEKGSFTGAERRRIGRFEQCDGGTIFLDEVGDMSPVIQGKVLRLLQDQRFQRVGGNEELQTNVRIIAATNRNLEEMVAGGQFREDLFYRLNGFTINLPPLRERREDIRLLLEHFLLRARIEMEKLDIQGIAPTVLETLCSYDWPGNVRQLQSVVRQAILNTVGTVVGPESLPDFILNPDDNDPLINRLETGDEGKPFANSFESTVASHAGSDLSEAGTSTSSAHVQDANQAIATVAESTAVGGQSASFSGIAHLADYIEERLGVSNNLYSEVVDQLECYLITRVLEATGGNQSRAAEILGITRGKIRDRVSAFNIQVDRGS